MKSHGTIVGQPAGIRKAIDDAFGTQIRLETASGVEDDSTFEIVEDRKLFEQSISNYVEVTANHLIKLKKRLNNLVTINRLPVELFTYIILLVARPKRRSAHAYISYSWVCHHWRSALIQNPTLWTSIRLQSWKTYDIIIHDLLRRSYPLKLDLNIHSKSAQFPLALGELFAKESDRIQKLWLKVRDIRFVSGKQFPSLRGVSCIDNLHGLYGILPILLASDHLETLQCSVFGETLAPPIHQLAPVFCRIRNLNITFHQFTEIEPLINLLQNSANLQNLQLAVYHADEINFTNQIVLPELQFLSADNLSLVKNIRAPKLSSLVVTSYDFSAMETIPSLDFSGIKYLYVLDYQYSIMGLKEPESSLSRYTEDFVEGMEDIISIERMTVKDIFSVNDMLSDPCPRNCFHFHFSTSEAFVKTLRLILYPLLSRMENLTELYLLHPALLEYFEFEKNLDKILILTPSVEKLVVQYGKALIVSILPLGNVSLCPRLNHLTYISCYTKFLSCEDVENYAEDIGRTLTECLQSRHEIYGDRLKYIAIEQCPPLSDTRIAKLRSLGTRVITAKDVESVLSVPEYQVPDSQEALDGDTQMNH